MATPGLGLLALRSWLLACGLEIDKGLPDRKIELYWPKADS